MIGKYKIAAFCMSTVQDENIQDKIYSMYKELNRRGWKLIIYNAASDMFQWNRHNMGEACVYRAIDYEKVDAIIIHQQSMKNEQVIEDIVYEAKKHGKKVLVLNSERERADTINLCYSHGNALRNLTEHLIVEHGFTRFGLVAGFKNNYDSDSRIAVIEEVLFLHGLKIDERFFGYGDFYDIPTKQVVRDFLQYRNDLPEAIICLNDAMAITVADLLIENDIRVPEDVVVTGFDGTLQGEYNIPRITTCSLGIEEMNAKICDILDDIFSKKEILQEYVIEYKCRFHDSCGCKKSSVKHLSMSVNKLYHRFDDTKNYTVSMQNMLSKMTSSLELEKVEMAMKRYIKWDSYAFLNIDVEDNTTDRCYDHDTFSEKMLVKKMWCDDRDIENAVMDFSDRFPKDCDFWDRNGPIFIMSLHDQGHPFGYFMTIFDEMDLEEFKTTCNRAPVLIANLNSGFGYYSQQKDLMESRDRVINVQNQIITGFADLVESRDMFTGQHIKRTESYIRILIKHLAMRPEFEGYLSEEQQEIICKAAPLHDIGKIKISDTILNKKGRLTKEEFDVIKTHTEEGSKIIDETLSEIEDPQYLIIAHDMALYHHEKWNGEGYPEGRSNIDIPLTARIMAVVDVFDALSSKRVYKEAFSMDETFRIIEESGGTHFDPVITEVFLSVRDEIEAKYNEFKAMEED